MRSGLKTVDAHLRRLETFAKTVPEYFAPAGP